MPDPGSTLRPLLRYSAIALAVLLVVGLATMAVWRWLAPRGPEPLDRNWQAVVSVVAGDGIPGMRDGRPFHARFSDPFGIAVAADGSIYVADAGDAQRIRRIAPDGAVSTLGGSDQGFADGPGAGARFSTPSALALAPDGALYVADTGNNMIRRVTREGHVSTIAGGLAGGFRDGVGRQALFNGPIGIAVDPAGRVIVADTYNDRVRAVHGDGSVMTLAGSGHPGFLDGPAMEAQFDTPSGVAVDGVGSIYVADTGNNAVRVIMANGIVGTLAAPADGLFRPIGIAIAADGTLYVTDDRGRIVEFSPDGSTRTIAGSRAGFANGAGADARFRGPAGIAVAVPGRLVVTDTRNALIRIVAAQSRLDLRPPAPPHIELAFDVDTFARKPLLWPLAPMEGPFEVTGTLGEARGGEGSERFHAGIDVHAAEGTPVRAVRDGVVTSPAALSDFGSLNESVRIEPLNYIHLRVGRDRDGTGIDPSRFVPTYDESGKLVRVRVKRGSRFGLGEPIGTINAFNHVHLNVGWPWEEYNPLRFRLMQFDDTVPPTIARGGIRLFGEDGQPLKERVRGRLVVGGRVHVVVDAWDQVDGNEPRRRLGVYRLGYQVLNRDGSPAPGFETPRETIEFDRLVPDPDAPRVVYASGSGIPFYGGRSTRFLYVVTNTFHGGVAAPGLWDTTTLAPGDYTLRILAADIRGNEAVVNRDLLVTKR